MSVYIDKEKIKYRRMIMGHMIADSLEELHEMAEKIGMKREWFQPRSFPHYDVSLSRRKLAVENGAVECDRHRFVKILRRLKREYLENGELPIL